VTTAESGRQLDESDFTFAKELAVRAAVAVDNARLFREAQEAEKEVRQVLEREHRIAERLQEALQPSLPGKLPGLDMDAHYRPALQEANIGGDFYDVFAIEKGCFALVVADLAGKGLAAASQVATVRHMLRALLYQHGASLSESVTRLNGMLAEHNLLTGFATLFVGAYDMNQRTLTYVNAGQEPGLVLRKRTGQVDELPPTGAVLGGFGEAAFAQETVPLASGDVIALFTDGLTEAGPSRKDLLEVPGVTAIFRDSTMDAPSAGQIKVRMMQGVEAIATPAGIRDDVCLLIACVE
jgi:sigma-B regulation protein RsbU (phosphoserine phosphatase)